MRAKSLRHAMPRERQRGAALLLAMIIVTLVATLAVSMVWQQWRAVQVETAERARAQSQWILSGALDWAGLILKEDARPSAGQVDHLGEPWAVPLAEARLSTFLASDKDNNAADDGPEAFLSGAISDAQARFNLRNLLDNKSEVSKDDLAVLTRLCENVNIAASVAGALATGMKAAYAPAGSGSVSDAPLPPKRISQLSWLGVDPQALQRLEPYVVLLPVETPVNLNTAPREVIAAVMGVNVGDAERLIQTRQRTPFKKIEDALAQLSLPPGQNAGKVAINTSFFEVRGRLRLNEHVLEQRSLVQRNGRNITVLRTERINTTDSERQ